ncbi:MAG: tRNA (guanosine(46)-N7)-methyltransferase TrmB [Hyphomicrobiaceae bacterium]
MTTSHTPEPVDDTGSDHDDAPRDLRSYGRRRGRKLSERQSRLMRELLPRLSPDLAAPSPARAADLFGGRVDEVWLEIGFGGGEHLVWQARNRPDVGLIGCEPFEDGVVKVLAAVEDDGLANVRVHADDARAILRWLPDASISRVFVLFPDPWPKARHRKRRLVNPATLAEIARVLVKGGELRLGTDIGDYARTMLVALQGTPGLAWMATCAADWRHRPGDWPQTRYEQKALREGRRCIYLRYQRI